MDDSGRIRFLVVVLLQAAQTASGQSLTRLMRRLRKILRENPDYKILIADVSMRDEKGNALRCGTMMRATSIGEVLAPSNHL